MERTAHSPFDFARHVAAQLRAKRGQSPSGDVLVRLFETLFFASLRTEEGRPPLCTVCFFGGDSSDPASPDGGPADHWQVARFDSPLPLDVRTLTKLARAADPSAVALAVACDAEGDLVVTGLIDQEVRYSDFIALDSAVAPCRPGLFQAAVTGVGNIAVSVNYLLIGSLEQDTIVTEYHDVLWSGPVHERLVEHVRDYRAARGLPAGGNGLLVRWVNALCRVLMNVQRYKHGGGLIISPTGAIDGLNVNYRLRYDRLPHALADLDRDESLLGEMVRHIQSLCLGPARASLPADELDRVREYRRRFDEHKSEVLGCTHFIASLTRVDGFLLLDRHLCVRGFGAEVRSGEPVERLAIAGDPLGSPRRLRPADMHQYGTRHRAMIRYCAENPGSLGFVVSQDGDIRALTRVGEDLVLWENIEVQLAFRSEGGSLIRPEHDDHAPRTDAA